MHLTFAKIATEYILHSNSIKEINSFTQFMGKLTWSLD